MRFKTLVCFVALISFTTSVVANDFLLRRNNSRCVNGRCSTVNRVVTQKVVAPVVQQAQAQTTVVNNLVGIPVPVTYSQPLQAQGTTIYGYSAYAQNYNNVDLSLLYNQAARLTDQAQQLSAQANQSFASMVQYETEKQAEIAKIIAQGQAARQALEAAAGQPLKVQNQSFSFKITQESNGDFKVEQIKSDSEPQANALDAKVQDFELTDSQKELQVSNILKQSCVKCHSNSKSLGGLNLEQVITADQQLSIIDRIQTDDPSIRMPKGGKKLSDEHIALIKQVLAE